MASRFRSFLCIAFFLLQTFGFAQETKSLVDPRYMYVGVPSTDAMMSLAQLNLYFITEHEVLAQKLGSSIFPILAANGTAFTLYTQDGKVRNLASSITPPANELKAVAHVGPALFMIGNPSWENNNDDSWKPKMQAYQKLLKDALSKIDGVNWSNPAWDADYTQRLGKFMRESLVFADESMTAILKKGTFTKEDYSRLCDKYMHTMDLAMYLANTAGAELRIDTLLKWKKEMGQAEWDKMYVLVFGAFGRPGAGLSLDTNPVAYQISLLMKPENRKSKIKIIPTATSDNEARGMLGAELLAQELGQAAFTKARMERYPIGKGLHEGLVDSSTNVSMKNDKDTAIEYLQKGKVKLPIPDWVKKEAIKFHKAP